MKTAIRYADEEFFLKNMKACGFTDPFDYAVDGYRRFRQVRRRQQERRRNVRHRKGDIKAAKQRAGIYKLYDCYTDEYIESVQPKMKKNFPDGCMHGDGRYARKMAEDRSNVQTRFNIRDKKAFDAYECQMNDLIAG